MARSHFRQALCLGSMQRRPPDLALVEFGVNTNARELPMLRRLLRTLYRLSREL